MICPNCNSDNTRRAKTIFESDTTNTRTEHTSTTITAGSSVYVNGGYAYVPGGSSTTTTTTYSTSQTIMAGQCEPPTKPKKPKSTFFLVDLIVITLKLALFVCVIFLLSALVIGIPLKAFNVNYEIFNFNINYETVSNIIGYVVALAIFVSPIIILILFYIKRKREKLYRDITYPKEMEIYKQKMLEYEQTWVCQKCGWVYVDPTTNIQ